MAISYDDWRLRLSQNLTDKQIDRAVTIVPRPLKELSDMTPLEAANNLEVGLNSMFIPSDQTRDILRALQASAATYISIRYPSAKDYLEVSYSSDSELARYTPQLATSCLLGLPGVGKSTVMEAFKRLFPEAEVNIPSTTSACLRSNWLMSIRAGNGLNQLVMDHFRDPTGIKRGEIFQATQRELCNQGVLLLIADELQFLTQGQGNTLPAKLLTQLFRLGPPLFFVANYSLIHRLNSRPQEEKQRLLTKPLFLHPDPINSADWVAFVQAALRIAPEFSKLPIEEVQSLLYSYSYGLRRLVGKLLCGAYLGMRKRGRQFVEVCDIEHAYASASYASCREDVELLASDLARPRKRLDLWCPLPGADAPRSPSKIVDHPAKEKFQQKLGEAALASSLSQEERTASGLTTPKGGKTSATPSRPRPMASASDLIESAMRLQDGVDTL